MWTIDTALQARRSTNHISNSPLPFACTLPRGVKESPGWSFTKAWVVPLRFTWPTSPLLYMRLAVFTVSPQMS